MRELVLFFLAEIEGRFFFLHLVVVVQCGIYFFFFQFHFKFDTVHFVLPFWGCCIFVVISLGNGSRSDDNWFCLASGTLGQILSSLFPFCPPS